MAKSHWGIKRVCNSGSCATRFYDFNKEAITCPKCGAPYSQKLSASSFYSDKFAVSSTPEPALESEDEDENTDTVSLDDVGEDGAS